MARVSVQGCWTKSSVKVVAQLLVFMLIHPVDSATIYATILLRIVASIMWATDISNTSVYSLSNVTKCSQPRMANYIVRSYFPAIKRKNFSIGGFGEHWKNMPCGLRHGMAGTKFECSLDPHKFLLGPPQICGRSFCLKVSFCEDSTACQTCGPMDRTQGRRHYLKTPRDFWPISHLSLFERVNHIIMLKGHLSNWRTTL